MIVASIWGGVARGNNAVSAVVEVNRSFSGVGSKFVWVVVLRWLMMFGAIMVLFVVVAMIAVVVMYGAMVVVSGAAVGFILGEEMEEDGKDGGATKTTKKRQKWQLLKNLLLQQKSMNESAAEAVKEPDATGFSGLELEENGVEGSEFNKAAGINDLPALVYM
ncbi:Hypothetical predicted protein [Olea europaea subsp. europaea]|uniref:Uncharacterized protein n=1 Tax=Olea europaea subsp. europaea TaxID=158383 RepID=A0A8S0V914_OLEEU|nr:Hypothetical predicted protein [Olea europaea subsp. europaea]